MENRAQSKPGDMPDISEKKYQVNKLIVLLVGLVIIIVLYGLAWVLLTHKNVSNKSTQKMNTVAVKLSPQVQKRIDSGLPPVAASADASINYITIPTGVIEKNTSPEEPDGAATANGHYLYNDLSDNSGKLYGDCGLVEVCSGKLIYDGKVVYQGKGVSKGAIILSSNGLHYGYVVADETFDAVHKKYPVDYSIYVDNILVKKLPEFSRGSGDHDLFLDGVSNDGHSYIYNYDRAEYKNGHKLYSNITPIGTSRPSLSKTQNVAILVDKNLENYLGEGPATGDDNTGTYIYSGKSYPYRFYVNSYDLGISENGLHYYLAGENDSRKQTHAPPKTVPNPNYGKHPDCGYADPECQHSGGFDNTDKTITTKKLISDITTSYAQLIVDGKEVYTSKKYSQDSKDADPIFPNAASEWITAGVNDSGDYFYSIASKSPYFMIDNKYRYPLPAHDFQTGRGPTAGTYDGYAAINNDLSHYIVGNVGTGYWNIDGKATDLSGDIFSVELEGNTLYIYRFSN
jgi:hypothetical protein